HKSPTSHKSDRLPSSNCITALNSQSGDSDGSTMSIFTTAATRTITIQEGEVTQTNQQDIDERGTLNDSFQQWIESTVPQISEITDTSANHSFLLELGLSENDIAIMDSCIPLPEQHTSRSLTSEVFPGSSGEQTSHDILLLTDRPKDRPSEAPWARKQECDKHRPTGVSSKPYRPPTPPAPTDLPTLALILPRLSHRHREAATLEPICLLLWEDLQSNTESEIASKGHGDPGGSPLPYRSEPPRRETFLVYLL
ncbi:hypothetical protein DFP72DRAFT_1152377, partial [Ephemerocybe angulata]